MNAVNKIREWIKANIISSGDDFAYRGTAPPQSVEEKLQTAMESTEFMPPDPFPAEGGVNPKFVEFYVQKVIDLIGSGLIAGFTWLLLKFTGAHPWPQHEGAEAAEVLLPAIVWLTCFVALAVVRARGKSKTKPLQSGEKK